MKNTIRHLVITTIFIIVSIFCYATNYFVATNGSDANNGLTTGTPFLTAAKAESVVVAGDVVTFAAGTYTMSGLTMSHSGSNGSPITFQTSGSVIFSLTSDGMLVTGAWRVIKGIAFSGTFTRAIYLKTANNIIQNVTVTQNSIAAEAYGIQVGENTNNTAGAAASTNTLDNVRILSSAGAGQLIHGILFGGGGTGNVLKNSYISGTEYGLVDKGDISTLCFNNVFNFSGANLYAGIYNRASVNSQYYNNILNNSGSGHGFILGTGDAGQLPSGVIIKNNVFIKNAGAYALFITTSVGVTTSTVISNYNCWNFTAGGTVVFREGVISYTSVAAWQSATGQDANSSPLAAVPTFTNPSGTLTQLADYTPVVGSPVINAGTVMSGRTTDAVGNPVVNPPDIGALEYQTSGSGNIYYISTTGSSGNPGTISSPWNFEKLSSANLVAGDIVYIRGNGGQYNSTSVAGDAAGVHISGKTGSAGAHILISAYPPDFPSGGRVIFNLNTGTLHTVNCFGIWAENCSYIDFYGINVIGPFEQPTANLKGTVTGSWYFMGSGQNLTATNCEGSFAQVGFRLDNINNVTYTNCDVHNLEDPYSNQDQPAGPIGPYGGSDGFSRPNPVNQAQNTLYRGCRAWWCSDDGWDCFGSTGTINYDSCWSFWNGYNSSFFHQGGDGNGYKLGPSTATGQLRTMTRCMAVRNYKTGFDQNTAYCTFNIYNCNSLNNRFSDWKFGYPDGNGNRPPHVFRNNISYNNCAPPTTGCAPIDGLSSDATGWSPAGGLNNSWNGAVNLTSGDFVSIADDSQLDDARQSNGTLPVITFGHLVSNSDLIDKGANVGLPFCPAAPDIGTFEVCTATSSLTVTPNFTPILCFGGTTTITVGVSGGTSPYQYQLNSNGFGSSFTFAGLPANTYLISVKDALGATGSQSVLISQPAQITIVQNSGTITTTGGSTTTNVTAGGGTTPYNYKLDGGSFQTGSSFTGVLAGNHTITVRDANLCTNTLNYTLTQQAAALSATAAAAVNPLPCFETKTIVTITAAGGTTPYTYNVNGGAFQSSSQFTGTGIGTYTYITKDATNATVTTTLSITGPNQITFTQTSGTISVNGGSTTTTVTNVSGGTGTKTYSLDGSAFQSSNVFTGVLAGNHIITVRDANLCTNTLSYTLTQPAATLTLSAAGATNPLTCKGGTTTVTLTATGGTTPYTYQQNSGTFQSSTSFTSVGEGTNTYTVKDATNALVTTTLAITAPNQITISQSSTPISVNGGTTTTNVTAGGGTGTLSYKLDAGSFQSSSSFTGVAAGPHTITVRDANLCTNTLNYTLTQPSSLAVTATGATNPVSCFNGTTTITAVGSGGVTPLQYNIDGGTYQTSATFTGKAAGTYTIGVRDNSLTTATFNLTITQPTQITITESHTAIAINGGTSSITVTATGGTSTKNYSLDGGTFQSSNVFSGAIAGNHTVTVRDANLCTNTLTFTITQPSGLLVSALGEVNPLLCNGATTTVTVTASGGTAPYTYQLNSTLQCSSLFSNVGAGTYTITVTDAASAVATTSLTVTQPTQISITESHTAILVNGGTSTVTASSSGGTGTKNYSLDGGAYQAGTSFSSVIAGNHTLSVREANLCINTLTFSITQPSTLAVSSAVTTAIACNGATGVITVTASGGTSPYLYKNGTGGTYASVNTFSVTAGTYQFFVQDGGGSVTSSTTAISQPTPINVNVAVNGAAPVTVTVTASGGVGSLQYKLDAGSYQSSNVFTSVSSGAHTITVRDANLCTQVKTFNAPLPIYFSMTVGAIACNGGNSSVAVNATGGTPPYTGTGTFLRAVGTWTFTVTDAINATADTTITISQPAIMGVSVATGTITSNGGTTTATITVTGGTGTKTYSLDGSAFQSSNAFSGVAAGNHIVTVKDANGCQATNSFSVTQPTNLTMLATLGTAIACNGGTTTVTLSGSGGTTPYTYGKNGIFQSSVVFSSVTAATYTFSVKDAFSNQHDTIIIISQPAALILSVSTGTISTNGGTTTVTASGSGGSGLEYSLDGGTYQSSGVFAGVSAGSHTVTLRDANLCTTTNTFTISQPGALIIGITPGTTIPCFNGGTSVTVTKTGGTSPYTYGKNGVFQGTALFQNLLAGTYTFSVKDAFNAQADTIITITQPPLIVITITHGTITTSGGTTTVTATAVGGTGSLQYRIDAGVYQGTGNFSGITAGTHTVQVKDANNCTRALQTVILAPVGITLTQGTPIACAGGTTTMTLAGSGGKAPYTYGKNGVFQAGTAFQSLTAGTYTFSVKDALSSRTDSIFTITQPSALTLSVVVGTISVNGGTTTVTATGSGGVEGFTYRIDAGAYQGSGSFSGVLAGQHTVTVKDANNCTTINSFSIAQPSNLVITISRGAAIDCYGGTQNITVGYTGGTAPVTGTGLFSKLANTYTFHIVDAFGAVADTIIDVTEPSQISIAVTTGTITVSGGTTTVTATASGGTGSLQYKIDAGGYQGTGSFTGVSAGPHTVTVKDANNCTNVNTFSISQPVALLMSISIVDDSLACNGDETSITVGASGGTPPYTGTGTYNIGGGVQTISVTDAFNAQHDTIINVYQPSQVAVLTIFAGTISTGGGTTSVTVVAAGGTGTIEYKLDALAYQASNIFTGVGAGNHTITVRDANLCTGGYAFHLTGRTTRNAIRTTIKYIQVR